MGCDEWVTATVCPRPAKRGEGEGEGPSHGERRRIGAVWLDSATAGVLGARHDDANAADRCCAIALATLAAAAAAKPDDIPPPPDVAAPPADAAKTPSGLATRVLQPGSGKQRPTIDDKVKVHYTGWTTDGKMFDSSVARGEPAASASAASSRAGRRRCS